MKILLTGYRGFIGQHLHRALEAQGHDVSTYEPGEDMPRIVGNQWVIHIGANSSTAERDVEKIMRENYDFSVNLYNTCRSLGIKFQYSSSASIYGLTSTFREDAPPSPQNPYAWTKYLFERYVQQNPSPTVAQGFRYFNVYGPEGEEHKGNMASPFYQFQQQAAGTGQVRVFENSQRYLRDFVPVEYVVDTHLKFLNIKESGVWNIGTGNTKSFLDVARMYTTNIVEIPMPDHLKSSYQAYTCADTTKLKDTLKKHGF